MDLEAFMEMARLAAAKHGPNWMEVMIPHPRDEQAGPSQRPVFPLIFPDIEEPQDQEGEEGEGEQVGDEEEPTTKRKRTMTQKAKVNREQAKNVKKPRTTGTRGKGKAQEVIAVPAPTPVEAPRNQGPPSTPATRPVAVTEEGPASLEAVKDAQNFPNVSRIQPQYGSTNGATRITISGYGFADSNQFNYGDNDQGGNIVQFVSGTRSIPCDVEKDASHERLLTCFTRTMPEDHYIVRLMVNGNAIPDANMCGGQIAGPECSFYATSYNTPTITSIQPLSGLPGSMITINGKIFTDVYGSNTALSSNGRNVRILRSYIGGMTCELLVPNSDTLYGLQLISQDMGIMVCKMTGTYVGHQNISFILDAEYGRSSPQSATYFVSSLNKITMFQTYAVVSAITPASGSMKGGTLLTISGQYFDDTDQPIRVSLGGDSCFVRDHNDTTIRCRAPPSPPRDALNSITVFPGGRGLKLEVWNNSSPTNLEDALAYNENTTGYAGASWVDSASYTWPTQQDNFVARLSGFLVVPESGNYTFFIQGDDRFALYFSQTGLPADKVKIASGNSRANSFFSFASQKSSVFLLQEENAYYMEIYLQEITINAFVVVGLYKESSSYIDQQTADAVNEVQVLESHSTVVLEKQVITLESWTASVATSEVQTITITCVDSCSSLHYTLKYNMESTVPLSADASSLDVQTALNALWSIKPNTVDVTRTDLSEGHRYTVTFNSLRGDFDLLNYSIPEGINITVDINEQTKGVPDMQTFTLTWDGIDSQPISANAPASEVQAAISGMVSSICPDYVAKYTENFAVKFFRDYETQAAVLSNTLGRERTSEIQAFCGRYTLKNPQIVFDSKDPTPGGQAYGDISLTSSNKFCLAYRGFLQSQIGLTFRYQDNNLVTANYTAWFPYGFAQGDSWSYACINLLDLIKTKYDGRSYFLKAIALQPRDAEHPLYVDVVYIGQTATIGSLGGAIARRPAALARRGIFISDIQVDEIQPLPAPASKQYALTITTIDCGYNIPLLAVAFTQVSTSMLTGNASGTENSVEYRGSTWPNDAVVTVERIQAASPPLNGTFDIHAYGRTISGLTATISAVDLQYALQGIPELGQLRVTETSGSCVGYARKIQWLSASGKQPLLQVDDSSMTGVNATMSTRKLTDGGLFRQNILGDLLRTPERQPQVQVYINGLPSQCAGKCGYFWDPLKTPVITGMNATDEGRNLTIFGSGFAESTTNDNTYVFIGKVDCPIITVSENKIVCQILQGSAGTFPVMVYIAERGVAQTVPDGAFNFTYNIRVTSISPTTGSMAGGTLVTIKGDGFSEQSQVLIDDNICRIIQSNTTSITCRTPAGFSGFADAVVSTNGRNATLNGCFHYTSTHTPTITSVTPLTSSVLGNTTLTLSGSNFGSKLVSSEVWIGPGLCSIIQRNSSHISCRLPSLTPGVYPVQLYVGNMGLASISVPGNGNIRYILEVTNASPARGSLYGGTKITIAGSGFSTESEHNKVLIGETPCQVTLSEAESLECIIESTGVTHTVTNKGRDIHYGLGYAWSPASMSILVGDTVTWQWDAPPFIPGVGYRVFSVSSPGSSIYDGEGFTSGDHRTGSGKFGYKFTSPGVYYYSSGSISDGQSISLQGTVTVLPAPDRQAEVHVRVGGHEALYHPARRRRSVHDCLALEPQCSPPLNGSGNGSAVLFEFSSCYSASITVISPSNGTVLDLLTITGTGFSNIPCANEVKVGEYPCEVLSSSDSELTCSVDPQNSMNVGVAEIVSLTVQNLGAAINTLTKEFDRRFALVPHISSVTPSAGSLTGKTRLTIQGSGFEGSASAVIVSVGSYRCAIVSVNYTHIKCDSPPVSPAQSMDVNVLVRGMPAQCRGVCNFSYSDAVTSSISTVSPTSLDNVTTEISIQGDGFGTSVEDILVYIGSRPFQANNVTENLITCDVDPFPAGNYTLTVVVLSKGLASGSLNLNSPAVAHLWPASGSIMGGTTLSITGNGFHQPNTTVTMGGGFCEVRNITSGSVRCFTPAHAAGAVTVQIVANSVLYPPLSFTYAAADTPQVASISPDTGSAGTIVTLTGSGLGNVSSDVSVTVGNVDCAVISVTDATLQCTVGDHVGGNVSVTFRHVQKGYAVSAAFFTYAFSIEAVSPAQGSFGGGQILTVAGTGFDRNISQVLICGSACIVETQQSGLHHLFCKVPPNNGTGDSQNCSVSVLNGNDFVTSEHAFTYRAALTPNISDVTPRRGGTGGGTRLTITGTGFSSTLADINVTIAGAPCDVKSANTTQIVCITSAQSPSQRTKVKVNIGGKGIAMLDHADFFYIDVWSSNYTWGGKSPPDAGSLAVISEGQTILLDQSTPVLKMLLIRGGSLIFDEADIELQAENILIAEGGVLQIGTEEAPFQHKAIITLHGQLRSPELPLYGAKTLAVREGILDLHGLPVPVTWTRLAQTAEAGACTLLLHDAVTWKVGDEIVIASTGHRHTQSQNEKRNITQVSADGRTLTIGAALAYKHLGISVTLPDGTVFEARAEVGLLTRNILIRGTDHPEWNDSIPACPDGFDTGEFATQTCFQGRFGEEIGSDQFGGCIMFHAPKPDALLATGRIEYVELFHVGQAFRLGRYPIHWHLMGDLQFKSYVRGCAIHQAYNRAVTIHNTHHLLVERNVIYDIMGGAFFIEDGIEHGNVLQYNLAVFVRQSTSLLNDDITPAGYWVTNPNNTIRHNAAAGGTHFGFWYRMHDNPDGPSYNSNICQKRVPLGEFFNNTVHSQGWFGIWIFEDYFPTQEGSCSSNVPQPAAFDSLTTWNCQKGAEWVNGGALHFLNFRMVNNEDAGIETKRILLNFVGQWGEPNGALIKNATIVGHLDELGLGSSYCTAKGIVLPFDEGLTISSTKFMNFNRSCAAIGVTSIAGVCTDRCGGWSAKFNGIQFYNTPNKAGFRWEHEVVLIDVDGSLTGVAGQKVIPKSPLLNPLQCSQHPEWSFGFDGCVCNSSVSFHRLAFNNPSPSSLRGQDVIISNNYGASVVPFLPKRLTHKPGWMALLPNANSFNWYFHDVAFITNISYTSTFYGFKAEDYVIISHNLTQRPDMFNIVDLRNGSAAPLNSTTNTNGDWHFDDNSTTLTYLVSGRSNRRRRAVARTLDPAMSNANVNLRVYQCFYKNCVTPPPPPQTSGLLDASRPDGYQLWSNQSFWQENNQSVPTNGSKVVIPEGTWVVADVDLPPLEELLIYGVLELQSLNDTNARAANSSAYKTVVLSATYISIQGGRLIGGYEGNPFQGQLHIILKGSHTTPELPLPDGPNQGSKVLGVFGGLDLHGTPRSVYKTKLSATALAGSRNISLVDAVDWQVGEDIVITTTGYSPWETETRSIISVSADGKSLSLNESLSFTHIAETHQVGNTLDMYTLAADVGLLSRNIKIIGNDYPGWYAESFGARVLVSAFSVNGNKYRGSARISNVEFYRSGQEGYRDNIDPRYSLAFLNLDEIIDSESYVQGCAFHNGFSPAIGVFGTNGLDIDDNIIHFTVGEGIRIWGERNRARRNLVTLAVWPATYRGRNEIHNLLLWHAGIEVNEGSKIVLQNNIVAGFERVAYRIDGEPCPGVNNMAEQWFGNEAHGGLYGVYMQQDGLPGCSSIQGFTIWKCWDYGIYFQTTESVQISNVTLADNGMGVISIIYTPPSTSHETSNKTVKIKDSLIVGSSPGFNCSDVLNASDPYIKLSVDHRSTRPPTGGTSGICWPTFASGHNAAPDHPQAGLMSYNAISGLMTVEDSTFIGFKNICSGERSVMFMTNPLNEDLQHPVHVSAIRMFDTANESKVFIHRPDVGKANPSDCVDMVCDAKKKALLKDLDGSFLGIPGSVIPQSEFQWDGADKRHGIGDYRIPKVMLTYLNGSRIPVNQVAPNKGIIRDSTCTYLPTWESYKCSGLDYEMLVIESLDSDTETRRLSPVAVLGAGYVDLLNGPQDHGWCSGYTCQKRVSLFHSIVASNTSFDIYFTSTSPQSLRLMLLNADNTKVVRVAIYYSNPQRLDVFVNKTFVGPNNAQWNEARTDFTLKAPTFTGEFVPPLNSTRPGENYFDSAYNMLYILLRGSTPVEVHTSPLLVISFNLPAMTVDQFYGGKNLVQNLAIFLKIPADKIRITKIVSAGGNRKRRATGLSVSVQIANPPTQDLSSNTNTTGQLQFSDFQNISTSLAGAAVSGTLSSSLNVTVSSMALSQVVPPPSDPQWQEMASAPVDGTQPAPQFLATVSSLVVVTQPVAGLPGQRLTQQPAIQALDSSGKCVNVGVSALTLTAKLRNSVNASVPDGLTGNTTIPFSSCWANYTDLVLVPSGTNFKIEFSLNNVLSQTRTFSGKSVTTTTLPPPPTTTTTTTTTTTKKTSGFDNIPSSGMAVRSGFVLILGIILGANALAFV
ncbi:fibrocystin-L [Ambystoma mexicanum]|uniref:fibrocystin-L n=1 Tax=Ambystoma mexicanum TaxID=8296 RepID=UPI0037E7D07C